MPAVEWASANVIIKPNRPPGTIGHTGPILFAARTPTVPDEYHLLARARQLDPAALAEIHETYYAAIFRYVAFRVGDRDTAEDLTSEVFTRLLAALRDKHAPQNTLRGWLYGVAARVVSDHHRKTYRAPQVELDEALVSADHDLEDIIERQLTHDRVKHAMQDLTEEQRHVLSLRFGADLPIQDVARILGKSEGAIKQLQARAVATLARKLSPQAVP
jgi:RNA polymerase sigma-70 factor (ECF subfamily)